MTHEKRLPNSRRVISIRMSDEQIAYLDDLQRRVQNRTGTKVTRTSLMMRLMHLGFQSMEEFLRRTPQQHAPGTLNDETDKFTA